MATQKGIGVVWGIGTANLTAGQGLLRPTQQSLGKDVELIEHRDTVGEVKGLTTFNSTTTLEMDVYPADNASIADAEDAAENFPAPGTPVTLTDTTDSEINGEWLVITSTKRKTNNDKTIGTLSLKRWAGISSYTTIT